MVNAAVHAVQARWRRGRWKIPEHMPEELPEQVQEEKEDEEEDEEQ